MGFFEFVGIVVCALILLTILKAVFRSTNNPRPIGGSLGGVAIQNNYVLAEQYYNSGFRKIQQQNFIGAITDFNSAIGINPSHQKAYIFRCFAKVGLENVSAIDDCNVLLQLNPNSIPAYCFRGLIKFELLHDELAAINDYNIAVRLTPHDALDYWARGTAKIGLGQVQSDSSLAESGIADQMKAFNMGLRLRVD
jgi:tetratricopeptide (TPR) repeat protein